MYFKMIVSSKARCIYIGHIGCRYKLPRGMFLHRPAVSIALETNELASSKIGQDD